MEFSGARVPKSPNPDPQNLYDFSEKKSDPRRPEHLMPASPASTPRRTTTKVPRVDAPGPCFNGTFFGGVLGEDGTTVVVSMGDVYQYYGSKVFGEIDRENDSTLVPE